LSLKKKHREYDGNHKGGQYAEIQSSLNADLGLWEIQHKTLSAINCKSVPTLRDWQALLFLSGMLAEIGWDS
jgi:hypothetical protein